MLTILKNKVPLMLRKMERPFKVSVLRQKAYLSSFSEPKDNIERSYYQYKCQNFFWGKWVHLLASITSSILLPIQMFLILIKRNPKAIKSIDLLLLSEDMPTNIFPDELLDKFPNRIYSTFLDGYSLNQKEWTYFFSLVKRYPFSPYYLFKCLIKIAIYTYQIKKYNPQIIATCGGEFTYTSSLLTDFCERQNIKHYNTMHGEMFYYILNSFSSFHKHYVWDDYYRELLTDLRATANEFIVTLPKSIIIDLQKIDDERHQIVDFKYYLQIQDRKQIKNIAKTLNKLKLKGFSICVRYHPRTTNLNPIYKAFDAKEIEDARKTCIELSFKTARNVIALTSTVLYQAYMSGVPVIIDDISDKVKYKQLYEMRYIMLSKKHGLLSQYINNGNFNK